MPGAGRSIRTKPVGDLWFDVLAFPAFFCLMVLATFLGEPEPGSPAWQMWAVRGGMALFFWLLGWLGAGVTFRELRRRGSWLPPGAERRPWRAAAGYVALFMLLAGLTFAGLLAGLVWVLGALGLAGG